MAYIKQKLYILIVLALLTPPAFLGQVSIAKASEITPQQVIHLVNESRLGYGLPVLEPNDLLTKAAQIKVSHMFSEGYFAHTSPSGITPWVWVESVGYNYNHAGENLAIHFVSAEDQHAAWMASPTHRKNILSEEYRDVGVAVGHGVLEGVETTVVVQLFGTKEGEKALPSVAGTASDLQLKALQMSGLSKVFLSKEKTAVMSTIIIILSMMVLALCLVALGIALVQSVQSYVSYMREMHERETPLET